jgi:hypothetical protein
MTLPNDQIRWVITRAPCELTFCVRVDSAIDDRSKLESITPSLVAIRSSERRRRALLWASLSVICSFQHQTSNSSFKAAHLSKPVAGTAPQMA